MIRRPRNVSRSQVGSFTLESLENRQLLSSSLPVVSVSAHSGTASETAPTTTGMGQFLVSRSGSKTKALTVNYHFWKGQTAVNGADYQELRGTVKIAVGKDHAWVNIVPIAHSNADSDRTVKIVLDSGKYTIRKPAAVITILGNNKSSTAGWWDTSHHYRSAIAISSGSYARTDQPVDNQINFTQILSGLGKSGAIVDNSIHVVETNPAGDSVVDANVPFQFDKAGNYDATTNAAGDLIIELKGATAANITRHYHVYFDTTGTFSAPSVAAQVSVSSGNDAVGDDSFKVQTAQALYVMQKNTGGLSAIIDKNSQDWVSYNSNGGSAGEYRGLPNMGVTGGEHPFDGSFPVNGSDAHATLVSSGPLKTTISVSSNDNNVTTVWEFYANFVRVSITKAANGNYWFLYEGTPGGTFNTNDFSVQSDGTTNNLGTSWDASNSIGAGANNGEWAYFASGGENRFLFMAHNTADNLEDSYYDLNNQMTVFGFGRTGIDHGQQKELTAQNNVFTFGLADNNTFSAASATINGDYRDVSTSAGASEHLP